LLRITDEGLFPEITGYNAGYIIQSQLKNNVMTSSYVRSELLSYYDLDENLQAQIAKDNDNDDNIFDDMYVIDPCDKNDVLPLSMFECTNNNNFTHGIYGQSYFSAYTITLSRYNDCAVVAYKHW
jgi:hypothetical protein